MDIDQVRTFLAVVETGSFVEAANKVFVTQSTVSMRIKALEERIGRALFTRGKAGAQLTDAGEQFARHAMTILRAWEQARLEISLPEGYSDALTVGSSYSLWDTYLIGWLARMREERADVAIKAVTGFSDTLMQRMIDGTLDIGVMYTPQSRPGLEIEKLFDDELVLVSSKGGRRGRKRTRGEDYIFVDWGPEFRADHGMNFPDLQTPGLQLELGSLGLRYLLAFGGSGYFPRRHVDAYLKDRQLTVDRKAPTFSYPAYVVYPTDMEPDFIEGVLGMLYASTPGRTGRRPAARPAAQASEA